MIGISQAGKFIKKTTNRVAKKIDNANIPEIIELILYADCQSPYFTADLAQQMRGATDMETLKNIFDLVQKKVKYKSDSRRQIVKSPGKLWADSEGDCKSFSIFLGSLLKNLGYKYKYRVTYYDPDQPNRKHIYPVVLLNGREITLDAVPIPGKHGPREFNKEHPYWDKEDYYPRCEGSINGISTPKAQWEWMVAALVGFIILSKMWE